MGRHRDRALTRGFLMVIEMAPDALPRIPYRTPRVRVRARDNSVAVS